MTIILDAMGSDKYPEPEIQGALDAAELFHEFDTAVLLQAVGQGEVGEVHAARGLLESHAHLRG